MTARPSRDVGRLDERIGYLVKRVQHLVRVHIDAALRDCGLSMAQFAVLCVLAEQDALAPAELARRCFISRQAMQDVLSTLQARGLINRHPEPARARPVTLTAAGRAAVAQADAAVTAIEQRLTAGLDNDAHTQLSAWLRHCAANLETDLNGRT